MSTLLNANLARRVTSSASYLKKVLDVVKSAIGSQSGNVHTLIVSMMLLN